MTVPNVIPEQPTEDPFLQHFHVRQFSIKCDDNFFPSTILIDFWCNNNCIHPLLPPEKESNVEFNCDPEVISLFYLNLLNNLFKNSFVNLCLFELV